MVAEPMEWSAIGIKLQRRLPSGESTSPAARIEFDRRSMTDVPDPPDPLERYRAKRSVERTPEPAGTLGPEGGRRYVFHKHAASHLHWDLRLEMDGVLVSWAVPKGPSFDQADKRLAVHVEDHPIEYGEFEGIIPEGNYGAGAVIIWDRGTWTPVEDPVEGLKKGKLLFDLHGHKLKGRWTLVKIKKSERDWLLIKERDGWMTPGGRELPEASVLSGLTVEELKAGKDPAAPIREELRRLGLKGGARLTVEQVEPMLAETADAPFSGPDWIFELKLDGYRMLAETGAGGTRLRTRNGREANASFPEIVRALAALPYRHLVLDGEIVALDDQGRPSFQRLQQRARFLRPAEIRQAGLQHPVVYYVFDLLAFEDCDLRALPLLERKALLRKILPAAGPVGFLDHFASEGERLFGEVERMGLEGLVAKRADSAYRGGRSPAWLKLRTERTGDFVVVGYTDPQGSRIGFGALQVADLVDGSLTYAGRVGSGFTEAQLAEVHQALHAARRETPPCEGPVPAGNDTTWVEPALVCEVRYKEWTGEGLLRQPVFLRFREDKLPEECDRLDPQGLVEPALPDPEPEPPSPLREVRLSNLDKVFWPVDGYTKGDLVDYYRAIAPWLLPYLRERPVVLTRYPDGIDGKSFFQKDAPSFVPEWIRTERMWSEQARREIDYFVCDDEPSLLYLANMAAIPLHVWASRIGALEQPDWCVLDLDPKGAPFRDVVRLALTLHRLCEEIGLPHYLKTSGSTGLHVLVPLGRQLTYEQSRAFGELLARVVVLREPGIATITRAVHRREGKVYLDYVQNGHGRLIVAPFSVRPLPGAPVSMPLSWDELGEGLNPGDYTIRTAPARMAGLPSDPLRPVLTGRPDLLAALGALQERLAG
jgi:bifunctional non-homologous end joining protein LigD